MATPVNSVYVWSRWLLDLEFNITLKFSTWWHYNHWVYFAGKFKVLGLPYYRKLTLHEIKVLEINAT